MKSLVTIVLAMLSTSAFAQTPYEFKGLAIGSTTDRDQIKTLIAKPMCIYNFIDKKAADQTCRISTTIVGKQTNMFVHLTADGVVDIIKVKFHPSDFGVVLEGLVTKYGTPNALDTSKVGNAMGAEFENVKACWWDEVTQTKMCAVKFDGKITEGSLTIFTAEAGKESKKEEQARSNDL